MHRRRLVPRVYSGCQHQSRRYVTASESCCRAGDALADSALLAPAARGGSRGENPAHDTLGEDVLPVTLVTGEHGGMCGRWVLFQPGHLVLL